MKSIMGNGRAVIREVLENDYDKGLNAIAIGDNIYISYITFSGKLVAIDMSGDRRVILCVDCDNIRDMENIGIIAIENEVFILYKISYPDGDAEIRYVTAKQGSPSQILYSNHNTFRYSLIHEEIGEDGETGNYYINIIEKDSPKIRRFKLLKRGNGIIDCDEYLIVRRETIDELNKKCLINAEECNRKLKAQQRENDERIKRKLKEQEKRFKKQYDQLSEMAKNIQDDGRRWRDLYYRSTRR
ncbi:MAG: hypothetical protein ACI4D8_05935 [Wujia sp.]